MPSTNTKYSSMMSQSTKVSCNDDSLRKGAHETGGLRNPGNQHGCRKACGTDDTQTNVRSGSMGSPAEIANVFIECAVEKAAGAQATESLWRGSARQSPSAARKQQTVSRYA